MASVKALQAIDGTNSTAIFKKKKKILFPA
jgi:hypothetical protein